MIKFISDNYLLCIAFLYLIFSYIICIRIKNTDLQINLKNNSGFAEMSFLQKQRLLLRGRLIKLLVVLITFIFAVVAFFRLLLHFNVAISIVFAAVLAVICSFVFLELMMLMSAVIRRLVSVKDAALNTLFSSVLVILVIVRVNMTGRNSIDFTAFVFAQVSLLMCYAMLVLVLVLILKEANDEHSELTLKNIWKSAFLTIILFLYNLSLMSCYCVLFDSNAISGEVSGAFDIFYYTVITFATVGYGDLAPVSTFAKAVSMVTVLTSILCLTVLLSEVVSVKKNKLKEK